MSARLWLRRGNSTHMAQIKREVTLLQFLLPILANRVIQESQAKLMMMKMSKTKITDTTTNRLKLRSPRRSLRQPRYNELNPSHFRWINRQMNSTSTSKTTADKMKSSSGTAILIGNLMSALILRTSPELELMISHEPMRAIKSRRKSHRSTCRRLWKRLKIK